MGCTDIRCLQSQQVYLGHLFITRIACSCAICGADISVIGLPPQLLAITTAFFELLAASLTTVRICLSLRSTRRGGSKRKALSVVLLEQGSLYIGFVSLFSATTIILFNIKATKGTFFELLLNALTIPVSGIMTCRFLIHLRDWESCNTGFSSTHQGVESGQLQIQEVLDDLEDIDNSEILLTWSDEFHRDPLINAPHARDDDSPTTEPVGAERV